jgi:uncharacterized protein
VTDVTPDTVRVADNPSESRYEAYVGDRVAGFVTYRLDPEAISFLHTEVYRSYRGEGIAGELARSVLDDARARGLAVYPFCPYIAEWIGEHREYADLVPAGRRAQFDLE